MQLIFNGIVNVEGDQSSRNPELRTEYKMHESIFRTTQRYFNLYVTVDLFASRVNA